MDPSGLKRRLTCILCTDAFGYSRLVNEDETGALRVLAAHRAVIDGVIASHDGRIANTAGDSVLAEFGSVVDGVRCAVGIQDALKTRNEALPEAQRMLFRIGINLGEIVVKGNDLLGDGVNVAARLQSIAPPGGILVSSSVYDQITGKLDLGFQDMGEQELKNISRPIRAFSVTGAGQPLRKVALGGEAATGKRPTLAVAIGTLALVAIAAGFSWQQGWIGAPRPAEVQEAKPDPAKAKLEADLAASERARAQAELRATTLDADVIRARASADAAALRAKAETETAGMKAKAQSDAAALQSKAQSDAAALRAQAAQDATRSKASDAQAIRARAETDAAALKASAEAEAAALKSTAEKEASALKSRSEKEAEAVRAKAQADIAAIPATAEQDAEADRVAALAGKAWEAAVLKGANVAGTAKAAVAAPASSDAARLDGAWVMWQQCSANMTSGGFTRSADFVATGGTFTIERGIPGQLGHDIARGRPSADGTLVLAGTGLAGYAGFARQFDIRLTGRWNGDRYVLRGHWGDRTCNVEVARK